MKKCKVDIVIVSPDNRKIAVSFQSLHYVLNFPMLDLKQNLIVPIRNRKNQLYSFDEVYLTLSRAIFCKEYKDLEQKEKLEITRAFNYIEQCEDFNNGK